MHIRQAIIYGFGKWVDYTIDFSAENFLCIYGDNEAGKSSIQHFITFMLFGLPPKKRAYYRPKTSGKMGGRLTVFEPDIGEFVIERIDEVENGAASCYTPDGKTYHETWLQERLKGMTQAVYQSIFSFSALDLVDIRKMKEAELGEVLLGIGLTGSKNMYDIEKWLDTKIGELFKPSGKKPELNQQLASLDDLFTSLQHYRKQEAAYKDKKAAMFALTDDNRQLQAELEHMNGIAFRIEKKQQALPVFKAYQHELEQLDNYPEHIPFPENGIDRLEKLNEQLLPLKSELAVLQHNGNTYAEKRDAIRSELYDAAVYERAEAIMEQKQAYMEAQKEIDRLRDSIRKLELQINTELEQLNSGISSEDLETLHLPFHVEKTWNQLKIDMEQLTLTRNQLQEELQQLTKNRDYLKAEQSKLSSSLLNESQENMLEESISHYEQQKYMEQEAVEQTVKWQRMKQKKEKSNILWLGGSFAAATLLGLFSVVLNQNFLLALAVVSLVIGAGQWLSSKRNLQDIEKMLQTNETAPNQVSINDKLEAERTIEANHNKKRELSSINEQIRLNDTEFIKCEEKQHGLQVRENRLNEQIRCQHKRYPFLMQIDIMYWSELFHSLKQMVKLYRDKAEMKNQCESLLENTDQYAEMANKFFHEMNWESSNRSMEDKLLAIEKLLENRRDRTALIQQYENWCEDNEHQQHNMKQKMLVYEQELAHLLAIAETETEEDFLQKGKQLSDKQKHMNKMSELSEQLSQMLRNEEYDALLSGENIEESQLKHEYEQAAAKIKELGQDIDTKRQQKADVSAELGMMESSESYSEALHRFTVEREKLNELAGEWAVYKTAKEMLAETKRNYRDKYLGKVIEKTSRYFQVLTGGVYPFIYPPSSDKPFRAEAYDGIRYSVDELSQGTVDQLYVSLRMGISEAMSEKHRLPFIIDDAFVHFDPTRTKRMIKLLSKLSANQQIILFTCKEDVRESAGNVISIPHVTGSNISTSNFKAKQG
ncbi:Uncharacterized protein YhaN [Lentibacillus halodurans]|uniref:Uncharacterized protein YhaN n=1 Tax=Lentibacillus halodurans TaxID=237679 RepID=A0A1I0VYP8_9BACI|nr:AAA family ATPase [Lentibacillus halodurans]SFA81308.1 Uncharacterized protein YhaN [Lentibacillus halodurans]